MAVDPEFRTAGKSHPQTDGRRDPFSITVFLFCARGYSTNLRIKVLLLLLPDNFVPDFPDRSVRDPTLLPMFAK